MNDWQDRIDCELRMLRQAEMWEQRSMEDRLLHAGHLQQQAGLEQPVTGRLVQYCRSTRSRILAGWRHIRRAGLDAILPAVAAGAGRRTGADHR
jgi:hypothetical protein